MVDAFRAREEDFFDCQDLAIQSFLEQYSESVRGLELRLATLVSQASPACLWENPSNHKDQLP